MADVIELFDLLDSLFDKESNDHDADVETFSSTSKNRPELSPVSATALLCSLCQSPDVLHLFCDSLSPPPSR